MKHALIFLVRIYQYTLSPALTFLSGGNGGCRFEPSCSNYAIEALQKHGSLRGSMLTLKRLCRCHPWGSAGFDPVPDLIATDAGVKSPLGKDPGVCVHR